MLFLSFIRFALILVRSELTKAGNSPNPPSTSEASKVCKVGGIDEGNVIRVSGTIFKVKCNDGFFTKDGLKNKVETKNVQCNVALGEWRIGKDVASCKNNITDMACSNDTLGDTSTKPMIKIGNSEKLKCKKGYQLKTRRKSDGQLMKCILKYEDDEVSAVWDEKDPYCKKPVITTFTLYVGKRVKHTHCPTTYSCDPRGYSPRHTPSRPSIFVVTRGQVLMVDCKIESVSGHIPYSIYLDDEIVATGTTNSDKDGQFITSSVNVTVDRQIVSCGINGDKESNRSYIMRFKAPQIEFGVYGPFSYYRTINGMNNTEIRNLRRGHPIGARCIAVDGGRGTRAYLYFWGKVKRRAYSIGRNMDGWKYAGRDGQTIRCVANNSAGMVDWSVVIRFDDECQMPPTRSGIGSTSAPEIEFGLCTRSRSNYKSMNNKSNAEFRMQKGDRVAAVCKAVGGSNGTKVYLNVYGEGKDTGQIGKKLYTEAKAQDGQIRCAAYDNAGRMVERTVIIKVYDCTWTDWTTDKACSLHDENNQTTCKMSQRRAVYIEPHPPKQCPGNRTRQTICNAEDSLCKRDCQYSEFEAKNPKICQRLNLQFEPTIEGHCVHIETRTVTKRNFGTGIPCNISDSHLNRMTICANPDSIQACHRNCTAKLVERFPSESNWTDTEKLTPECGLVQTRVRIKEKYHDWLLGSSGAENSSWCVDFMVKGTLHEKQLAVVCPDENEELLKQCKIMAKGNIEERCRAECGKTQIRLPDNFVSKLGSLDLCGRYVKSWKNTTNQEIIRKQFFGEVKCENSPKCGTDCIYQLTELIQIDASSKSDSQMVELYTTQGFTKQTGPTRCGSARKLTSFYQITDYQAVSKKTTSTKCLKFSDDKQVEIKNNYFQTEYVPVRCLQNCVPLIWEDWNQCSVSCGIGSRRRSRRILFNVGDDEQPCDTTEDIEPCMFTPCDDGVKNNHCLYLKYSHVISYDKISRDQWIKVAGNASCRPINKPIPSYESGNSTERAPWQWREPNLIIEDEKKSKNMLPKKDDTRETIVYVIIGGLSLIGLMVIGIIAYYIGRKKTNSRIILGGVKVKKSTVTQTSADSESMKSVGRLERAREDARDKLKSTYKTIKRQSEAGLEKTLKSIRESSRLNLNPKGSRTSASKPETTVGGEPMGNDDEKKGLLERRPEEAEENVKDTNKTIEQNSKSRLQKTLKSILEPSRLILKPKGSQISPSKPETPVGGEPMGKTDDKRGLLERRSESTHEKVKSTYKTVKQKPKSRLQKTLKSILEPSRLSRKQPVTKTVAVEDKGDNGSKHIDGSKMATVKHVDSTSSHKPNNQHSTSSAKADKKKNGNE